MSTLPVTSNLTNLTPAARAKAPSVGSASYKAAAKSVLAYLSGILKALAQSPEDRRLAQQETYLAEATSIYDLEWRMREMDRREYPQPLHMKSFQR